MGKKKKVISFSALAELILHEKRIQLIIDEYQILNDKLDKVILRIKNRKDKEYNN